MSHAYYNELWLVTRSDMEKILNFDRIIQETTSAKSKKEAFNLALPLYLKYRSLVSRLIVCYDQMVQSQKRDLIKKVLDCAIGRLLEYKREIVKLDFSDYQWPDDLLNIMKITLDDIDMPIPEFCKNLFKERREYIDKLIEDVNKPPDKISEQVPSETAEKKEESEVEEPKLRLARRRKPKAKEESKVPVEILSPEEIAAREAQKAAEQEFYDAILLIQSHERARVARSTAARIKRDFEYNRKLARGDIEEREIDIATKIIAATKIQSVWRSFVARKNLRKRSEETERLLGMTIPSRVSKTTYEVFRKDKENFQRRMELIPTYAENTKKAIEEERARLLRVRGPGLMEDITDEIREWFLLWYNELGYYDVFPAANLGGSILIATGETRTPQEFLMELAGKGTSKTGEGKKPKKGKSKEKSGNKSSKWKMPATKNFDCLEKANKEFIVEWSFRDESTNPNQREYMDLISNQLCYELQLEMREVVDDLMRLELDRLNQALKKDHADDEEKFVSPTMQNKQKKKGTKKRKGKIKRGKKDVRPDSSVEDLLRDLVKNKIVRSYPPTSLNDWMGDLSYQNYEARSQFRQHKYRLGEIKNVIMEYCVLPMISKETHQTAPLTRAVCICGLPLSGKSFLVNAICSELGALLFDLSPELLVDKYPGAGNEQKLVDTISKLSRIYAPSIIFVDGGEKPWLKKITADEERTEPKRLARYYPKLVKNIKAGEQILFLTVSSEPYRAGKAFTKIHNKFIIIPVTDYNTLYMYYMDLLMKYHNVDRNIDVSCLAKLSEGIPLEFIRQTVEKVLGVSRRITLKFRPLTQQEIMTELFEYKPYAAKTVANFEKFVKRLPLERKRKKLLAKEKAESQASAARVAKRK